MARSQLKDYISSVTAQSSQKPVSGSKGLSTATSELELAQANLNITVEDFDTAVCSAEGLTEIVASLEATLQNGGLDPVAAQFVHHAVDGYMTPLGVTNSDESIPSLESFGGDTSRIDSTAVSIESIKELAQKVWAAIKQIFAAVIKSVSDFFSKLFGGVGKLQGRIEELQKKQAELKKNDAKLSDEKAMLKVHGATTVAFKGKFQPSDISSGSSAAASLVKNVNTGYVTVTEKAMEEMAKVVKEKGEELKDEDVTKVVNDAGIAKELKDDVDKEVPGGKTIKSEDKDGVTSLSFGAMEKAAKIEGDMEVKPFTNGEIEKILNELSGPVEKLNNFKGKTESYKKSLEKFQKDMENAAKDGVNPKATKGVNLVAKESASLISSVNSYYFSYVRALLKNVERALSLYEGGKSSNDDNKEDK